MGSWEWPSALSRRNLGTAGRSRSAAVAATLVLVSAAAPVAAKTATTDADSTAALSAGQSDVRYSANHRQVLARLVAEVDAAAAAAAAAAAVSGSEEAVGSVVSAAVAVQIAHSSPVLAVYYMSLALMPLCSPVSLKPTPAVRERDAARQLLHAPPPGRA